MKKIKLIIVSSFAAAGLTLTAAGSGCTYAQNLSESAAAEAFAPLLAPPVSETPPISDNSETSETPETPETGETTPAIEIGLQVETTTETVTETTETASTETSLQFETTPSTPPIPYEELARELADSVADENGIDNAWALYLINAKNPLPSGYAPYLADAGGFKTDSRCAEYAKLMVKAAANDGVTLNVVSAYRSISRQDDNFKNYFDNLLKYGYSRERAYEITASNIAPPYASEHNAGLALDIGIIDDTFEKTREYKWLIKNSYKFGFIARYPGGKTDITGIIYEPWHFRFVGLYHAEAIYNSGLCLEEYMGDDGADNDYDGAVAAFKEKFVS